MKNKKILLLALIAAFSACGKHEPKKTNTSGKGLIFPPVPGMLTFTMSSVDKNKIECVSEAANKFGIVAKINKTETETFYSSSPSAKMQHVKSTQYSVSGNWSVAGDSVELVEFSKELNSCQNNLAGEETTLTMSFKERL